METNQLDTLKAQCVEANQICGKSLGNREWLLAILAFGKLCARLKPIASAHGGYANTLHDLGITRSFAWRAERIATRWAALDEVPDSMNALSSVTGIQTLICEMDDLLEAQDIEKLLRNGQWRGLRLRNLHNMNKTDFYRAMCKSAIAADQETRLREKCLDVVTQSGTTDPLGDAKRLYEWIAVWQCQGGE